MIEDNTGIDHSSGTSKSYLAKGCDLLTPISTPAINEVGSLFVYRQDSNMIAVGTRV